MEDVPGRLQRKYSPKKWDQMYINSVRHKLDMRDKKELERRLDRQKYDRFLCSLEDDESVGSMATLSIRSSSSRAFLTTGAHKKKAKARATDVNVHEEYEEPPQLSEWKTHWGNQLLCYLCSQPCLHECVNCSSCNNIAHKLCVLDVVAENKDAVRTCLECLEQLHKDQAAYEQRMMRLKQEMLRDFSATVVQRRAEVFLAVRRLRRQKAAIIRIQTVIRGCVYRKRYREQLRSILRLLLLNIVPCVKSTNTFNPEIFQQTVFVISVQDTYKNTQYFRLERPFERLDTTAVTIPGINWFMSIIITMAIKDDTKSYLILGQTQLSMKDIIHPSQPTEVDLPIFSKILWMPQEVHGVKTLHLVTTGRITSAMRAMRDSLVLQLHYLPQNPVTTCCQYANAPPLDVLRRVMDTKVKRGAGNNNGGIISNSSGGNINGLGATSGAMNSSGAADGGGVVPSGGGQGRTSRYWIALYHLRLLFYQHHGDEEPRHSADIRDARIEIVRDKGHLTSLVNIVFPDQRLWLLEFNDRKSAVNFEVAVTESKRALRDNSSLYMRQGDFDDDVSIGFR